MQSTDWSGNAFDQAPEFMGILDLTGRLQQANQAALGLGATALSAIRGRFLWEIPWWAPDSGLVLGLKEAIALAGEGTTVRQEFSILPAKGKGMVMDFSFTALRDQAGRRQCILVVGRDITAFDAQRASHLQEEAKFRLLFERSPDGILLLDGDTFLEGNPAALAQIQCAKSDFLRIHPWDISPPCQPDGRDSREKGQELIKLAHERNVISFEWMHRKVNGEDFPVEVTLIPVPLGGKTVLYTTWRDLTHLRKSEQERLELERQLLHTQKLESLGVLAGGIAHDFNNLLTAILGHLNLALDLVPPDSEVTRHLHGMERSVLKAADLTRQMLAYSGKGRFQVERLDLNQIVKDNQNLLHAYVSKKIVVKLNLMETLPCIEADVAQVQQVVMNLLTNAADAIGEREGEIQIVTFFENLSDHWIKSELAGWPVKTGLHVGLSVSDTGCGMTPEMLGRIFDPFFSTKGAGRGLGLSALQGILRSHHAGLMVRSRPGQGTVFRLYFPASLAGAGPAGFTVSQNSTRLEGLVLLVDDDISIRETTGFALQTLGLEVVMASDGFEALEQAERYGEKLQLVLLDLTMPHLGGLEVLKVLRERYSRLPVVLSSGYSVREAVNNSEGLKPAGFLQKPYRLNDLRQVISRVLNLAAAGTLP